MSFIYAEQHTKIHLNPYQNETEWKFSDNCFNFLQKIALMHQNEYQPQFAQAHWPILVFLCPFGTMEYISFEKHFWSAQDSKALFLRT